MSTLEPLAESMLGLIELLELRRLRERWSFGLRGCRPDWRAKRFKISVNEMTPVRRPEIRAPGRAAADTAEAGKPPLILGETGMEPGVGGFPAYVIEGVERGVAGFDGDGDADSTTHIRWERVATSLATVCANVEYGLT